MNVRVIDPQGEVTEGFAPRPPIKGRQFVVGQQRFGRVTSIGVGAFRVGGESYVIEVVYGHC